MLCHFLWGVTANGLPGARAHDHADRGWYLTQLQLLFVIRVPGMNASEESTMFRCIIVRS